MTRPPERQGQFDDKPRTRKPAAAGRRGMPPVMWVGVVVIVVGAVFLFRQGGDDVPTGIGEQRTAGQQHPFVITIHAESDAVHLCVHAPTGEKTASDGMLCGHHRARRTVPAAHRLRADEIHVAVYAMDAVKFREYRGVFGQEVAQKFHLRFPRAVVADTTEGTAQTEIQRPVFLNLSHDAQVRKALAGVEPRFEHHAPPVVEVADGVRGWEVEGFTVGAFKDRFGLTRKLAIPILEWLDAERLTLRQEFPEPEGYGEILEVLWERIKGRKAQVPGLPVVE